MTILPTVSRDYNSWEADTFRGVLRKKSNTVRLRDEIIYYTQIPEQFKIWFPRLIDHSLALGNPWMDLEYYPYKSLGEHVTGPQEISPLDWAMILSQLSKVLDLWKTVKWPHHMKISEHLYQMYITKTAREYKKFAGQDVPEIFQSDTITYNNIEYRNFRSIWNGKVKSYIQSTIIPNTNFSFIHGDFCFPNILLGGVKESTVLLKFIDPRGRFGFRGHMGDPRYDVAKLSHSVYGAYECLNSDKFELELIDETQNSWHLEMGSWRDLTDFFDAIFYEADGFSKKEIRTIEGLIFVGACARHYENPKRQVALYLQGIKALNDAMNMEE